MCQKKIYEKLKAESKPMTGKQISDSLQIRKSTVYRACAVMRRFNEIDYIPTTKGRAYYVKDEIQ